MPPSFLCSRISSQPATDPLLLHTRPRQIERLANKKGCRCCGIGLAGNLIVIMSKVGCATPSVRHVSIDGLTSVILVVHFSAMLICLFETNFAWASFIISANVIPVSVTTLEKLKSYSAVDWHQY